MKNIILVLSVLMMVGLSIGTYFYQKQDQMTYPKQYQPNPQDQTQQPKPLRPVNYDQISYSLQNNELNITYNKGTNWVKVPIEKNLLFDGEYRGNKQELIEGSYILTENRAAFLYAKGDLGSKQILLTYSLDQGKTWQDAVVKETFPSLRFRKVNFLNDHFGYVILSGDRTMSQEYSIALLTHDGGKSWQATKDSGNTSLIYDGGFIDETTGFMSYGILNPEQPNLYVTQNGGNTWRKGVIAIPEKYARIFVQAEIPVKEGDYLSLLVNQGPNGDYEGGKVKGKFISKDKGKTWEFLKEVKPNEAKQE